MDELYKIALDKLAYNYTLTGNNSGYRLGSSRRLGSKNLGLQRGNSRYTLTGNSSGRYTLGGGNSNRRYTLTGNSSGRYTLGGSNYTLLSPNDRSLLNRPKANHRKVVDKLPQYRSFGGSGFRTNNGTPTGLETGFFSKSYDNKPVKPRTFSGGMFFGNPNVLKGRPEYKNVKVMQDRDQRLRQQRLMELNARAQELLNTPSSAFIKRKPVKSTTTNNTNMVSNNGNSNVAPNTNTNVNNNVTPTSNTNVNNNVSVAKITAPVANTTPANTSPQTSNTTPANNTPPVTNTTPAVPTPAVPTPTNNTPTGISPTPVNNISTNTTQDKNKIDYANMAADSAKKHFKPTVDGNTTTHSGLLFRQPDGGLAPTRPDEPQTISGDLSVNNRQPYVNDFNMI